MRFLQARSVSQRMHGLEARGRESHLGTATRIVSRYSDLFVPAKSDAETTSASDRIERLPLCEMTEASAPKCPVCKPVERSLDCNARLLPQRRRKLTLDDAVLLSLVLLSILDARDLLHQRIDNLGQAPPLGAVLCPVPLPPLLRLSAIRPVRQDVRNVRSSIVEDEVLRERRGAVFEPWERGRCACRAAG